jgi:hypothetical protein
MLNYQRVRYVTLRYITYIIHAYIDTHTHADRIFFGDENFHLLGFAEDYVFFSTWEIHYLGNL